MYEHRIAAQTDANLRSIQSEISFNDLGAVVFIGTNPQGNNAIWISTGIGVLPRITSFVGGTRDFAFPQINNAGLISARDRVSGAPASFLVRTWTQDTNFTTIAYKYQGNPVQLPSISNDGFVSFVETTTTAPKLVTRIVLSPPARTSATPLVELPDSVALRPVVGDGGRIAVRLGGKPTDPIVLISSNGTQEEIASAALGFTALGRSPGISDDGEVIVFAGILSDAGAQAWRTKNGTAVPLPISSGVGIYASSIIDGSRRLIRVAGLGSSGSHIDAGERQTPGTSDMQGPDYNYDDQPDWDLSGFTLDARVSISNKRDYSTAAHGEFRTVVYACSNLVSGVSQPAVFSSRLNWIHYGAPAQTSVGAEAPILVLQAGDTIPGLGSITAISVHDSANNVGEVASLVSVGSTTQAIIVSKRTTDSLTPFSTNPGLSQAFINKINGRQRLDPDSPLVDYVVTGIPANRVRRSFNYVVVHATVGNKRASLGALADTGDKSIHYLVTRDGQVIQVIPEDSVANHGANPGHPDNQNGNADSIGIELVDDCRPINNGMSCAPGTGHRDDPQWFTPLQEAKTALLIRDICRRHGIPATVAGPLPALLYPATNGDRFPHEPFNNAGNSDFEEGNGEPVTNDDSAVTKVGTAVTIPVTANDVDDKNAALTVHKIVQQPQHGNVQLNGGSVTYTPAANWPGGTDSFTYTAIDPEGGFSNAKTPATVTISVLSNPNVAPANTTPALSATTREQQRRRIRVRDGFPHTYRGVITHGQILNRTATKDDASPIYLGLARLMALVNLNPIVLPTPIELASRPTVPLRVSEETISNVDAQTPPIAADDAVIATKNIPTLISVLANDDLSFPDAQNGAIAIVTPPAHGRLEPNPDFPWLLTYTPESDYSGTDEFTYRILFEEGDGSEPARVSIQVFDDTQLADLSLAQIALPESASPTSPVHWKIELRNYGPATAQAVNLAANLPSGWTLGQTTLGEGTLSISGDQIQIHFPQLSAGQLAELDLTFSRSIEYGSLEAIVTSQTPDPNPSNRSGTILGSLPEVGESLHLSAKELSDGSVEVQVLGTAGAAYHLEGSKNLVDWIEINQGQIGDAPTKWGAADFLAFPFRFFRARLAP